MADSASELARLKDLLLQPEAARLERLNSQVGALDRRLGTRKALEEATAEVLVDAFRQTETRQHRELARAVAPVVVAAIQSEIRNSRDMMVEALYPITGRLVAAAVANAFSSLVASVNERVDTMLSMRLWKLRLKSWVTGRPLSELLLAEATRPHLRRLLFIEKGSGMLLASWHAQPVADDRDNLVGGMIAAITDFSANAFEHEAGELRTIDMGASRLLLRPSSNYILAGEFVGPIRPQDEQTIGVEFEKLIDAHRRSARVDHDDLQAVAEDLLALSQVPKQKRKLGGLLLWIVAAFVLALLAAWGYRAWTRASFEREVRAAFATSIAGRSDAAAYPITLQIDHANRAVALGGLAPSQVLADAIVAAVAKKSGDYSLQSRFAVVASEGSLVQSTQNAQRLIQTNERALENWIALAGKRDAALTQSLDGLDTRVAELALALQTQQGSVRRDAEAAGRALGALEQALAALRKDVAAQKPELEKRGEQLAQLTAALQARGGEIEALAHQLKNVVNPVAAAERFMRRNAIFFAKDRQLRDAAAAGRTLDELAALLREAGIGVRIVGYASETGTGASNRKLAEGRAQTLADLLGQRGIAADRIVIVSRGATQPIDSAGDSEASGNRRAEFEPLFAGEKPRP